MPTDYKHNHYVPEWYQWRFLPEGQNHHYYLDLKPETITNNGHTYTRKSLLRWGPGKCFAQDDLYTTKWGGLENRDIEKFFFGKLDRDAPAAVDHFTDFKFGAGSEESFKTLLTYLSVQKLRTPKGLAWLRQTLKLGDKTKTLFALQQLQRIFCAIWTECVWQIADASQSDTKFIISDHPVVVYNRDCFPGSKLCLGDNDPDIRRVATHTYFPLSSDKILILTNLSWVRDPYQKPMGTRPNPDLMRNAIFKFTDIQVERYLTEEEVLEINYITKQRARRYIAAAEEEWLYPERRMRSHNWRKLGDGYLLMPDPRHIHGGGQVIFGFGGGRSEVFGEYGHRPWQQGYEDQVRERRERVSMEKFKAEWSATHGPEYRGVIRDLTRPTRYSMGEEWHAEECRIDRENLKKTGEKARRRKLKR